ncbi:helix-turn-helix domain-containing protein [Paracraurococcus ruber]|uniref:Fur family transcriptional regulator n=1 Tax=Paracraurococcus ruber TaxID=77675 RepID=A0ABS1CTC1_9PROT|nr:Fur family transcriptional regulator [Paracraurococcus ruber]MBK1657625.1 Fur family transcriptional regulator [Paracraurococcus ruber]TDG34217.1 Fur family transcriptional regulator [Paracraurococcus ruber]
MGRSLAGLCRQDLRRAGLPGTGDLARLLALLRAAPETHVTLADAEALAARAGLPAAPQVLARHLDMLAAHGLLGRLPSISGEPVFDTVPEPHSHLVYEETGQTVDLDVSPETLLALLRQALADRPGGIEVLVRVRRDAARR